MNKYTDARANVTLLNHFNKIINTEDFRLLEIGCNTGYNLKYIYDRHPNAHYFGVDILPDAIQQASEILPQGNFFVGDIEKQPLFFGEKFDYIILADVIEHLSDPYGTLKYIKTFLKPKGKIIANIPNLMHWTIMIDLCIGGNFSYLDTGLLDSDHKHLFTYNEILKLFEGTGYKIVTFFETTLNKIPAEYEKYIDGLVELSENTIPKKQYEVFSYFIFAQIEE